MLALPLAALVLMFCASVAASGAEHGPTCGGLDSSGRVCAQSGAPTPVLALVHQPLPAHTSDLPFVVVSPPGALLLLAQHHAHLATPRSPPDCP